MADGSVLFMDLTFVLFISRCRRELSHCRTGELVPGHFTIIDNESVIRLLLLFIQYV